MVLNLSEMHGDDCDENIKLTIGVNKKVEVLLSPCLEINRTSNELKNIVMTNFISSSNYLFHLRSELIDIINFKFISNEVHENVLAKASN